MHDISCEHQGLLQEFNSIGEINFCVQEQSSIGVICFQILNVTKKKKYARFNNLKLTKKSDYAYINLPNGQLYCQKCLCFRCITEKLT